MTKKLSQPQRIALEQVANGKVTYGDPFPERTRRITKAQVGKTISTDLVGGTRPAPTRVQTYATMTWMVDGYPAYGQQARTFSSLERAGLIVVHYDDLPTDDTGSVRVTLAET